MKETYVVGVSMRLEISASSGVAAMEKAYKKFAKYHVDEISVFNQDGTDALKITPEPEKV